MVVLLPVSEQDTNVSMFRSIVAGAALRISGSSKREGLERLTYPDTLIDTRPQNSIPTADISHFRERGQFIGFCGSLLMRLTRNSAIKKCKRGTLEASVARLTLLNPIPRRSVHPLDLPSEAHLPTSSRNHLYIPSVYPLRSKMAGPGYRDKPGEVRPPRPDRGGGPFDFFLWWEMEGVSMEWTRRAGLVPDPVGG
jgi:hypothetical protein